MGIKTFVLAALSLASLNAEAQKPDRDQVSLGLTFGSKVMSSYTRPVNGNYEGFELSYRTQTHSKLFKYLQFQVSNSDLIHLKLGRDSTTKGKFKPEYALAMGRPIYFIKNPEFKIALTPQVGAGYANKFTPIGKMQLRFNFGNLELSASDEYRSDRIISSINYFNRLYIGIAITQ